MATRLLLLLLLGSALTACKDEGDDAPVDAGVRDTGTAKDSGPRDAAAMEDAGSTDALPGQDAQPDAGRDDLGREDSGTPQGPGALFRVFTFGGDPVAGATVEVGGNSYLTGDDGIAFAPDLAGEQVFVVSAGGFLTTPFGYDLPADSRVLIDATLHAVPVPTALDDGVPGTILGATGIANFEADSFETAGGADISGEYQAHLLPLDPTIAAQVLGAPLPFLGLDAQGNERALEIFAVVEIQASQNGAPLQVKAGSTARLELVIPAPLLALVANNEVVPAWSFDAATGRWREELDGTVTDAAFGSRIWTGDLTHFSWWAVARPFDPTCLATRSALSGSGAPVSGALVRAIGIDHGFVGARFSSATGDACHEIKPGGNVAISAIHESQAALLAPVVATGGLGGGACGGGNCAQAPLELAAAACAEGVVLDGQGAPFEGASVQLRYANSSGQQASSFSTTDLSGGYCALGPSESAATLIARGDGFTDSATVAFGADPAACGQSCARASDLILADFIGGCVHGSAEIYNGMGNPLTVAPEGTPVFVYSGSAFTPSCAAGADDPALWGTLEASTTVGPNGDFCVSAFPLGGALVVLGDCSTWPSELCGPAATGFFAAEMAVCGQPGCVDLGAARYNTICDGS